MAEAYDRAYILSTKMDAREARRLVDQAVRIIAGMGHDITLDPKMKSGDGGMMPNPDGTISYKIGIKEIIENPKRPSTSRSHTTSFMSRLPFPLSRAVL